MLKTRSHGPRYTLSVDIFDLPQASQDVIRNYAVSSENMHDYADGDFYTVPDFSLLERDTTSDDLVASHAAGDLPDDAYPVQDEHDEFDSLPDYLRWLQALRFIAANLPPGILTKERVAIHVWH